MWHQNETDIENLEHAKIRFLRQSPYSYFIDKTKHSEFLIDFYQATRGKSQELTCIFYICVPISDFVSHFYIFLYNHGKNLNIDSI